MQTYCLKYIKDNENVNSKVFKTKNGKPLLPKCAICGSNKSRFMEEQEAKLLLVNSLGLKTPLSNIPWLGKILL